MIRTADGVLFRELDGEGVLLNLDTGTYFGLNAVGARMWQLLSEHGSVESAKAAMLLEFDVDEDTVLGDLRALVRELAAKALIVVGP